MTLLLLLGGGVYYQPLVPIGTPHLTMEEIGRLSLWMQERDRVRLVLTEVPVVQLRLRRIDAEPVVVVIPSYAAVVLADNPRAYWRLGEPSGAVAQDESANNFDLTYIGSPTLGQAGAVAGADTAVSFNGTSQYASRTSVVGTTPNVWTMECWAKPATLNGRGILLGHGSDSGGASIAMGLSVGNPDGTGSRLLVLRNQAGWNDTGYNFVSTTSFIHIVVTRDGTTTRYYVNGVALPATDTGSFNPASPRTTVGAALDSDGVTPFRFWPGTLDEVAFYDAALSPARIAAHYAARL